MFPEYDVKRPKEKKLKTMKKCPKCDGTDLMVLPGSTTYYACKNLKCPNNQQKYDNQKTRSINTNN